MPAINSERVLTGNRAILRVASSNGTGRVLGVGVVGNFMTPQDVNGQSDYGLQDVYGLGHAEREEIVIGAVRHSISINTLRINRKDAGFDPREIINNEEIEITVMDRKEGEVLESYSGCKCRTRGWGIGRNALATQALAFEAITAEKSGVD